MHSLLKCQIVSWEKSGILFFFQFDVDIFHLLTPYQQAGMYPVPATSNFQEFFCDLFTMNLY